MKNQKQMPMMMRMAEIRAMPMMDEEGAPKKDDAMVFELALSSETPVERHFGMEVLGHAAHEVDLSRFEGAPLLMDHDPTRQVGVITSPRIGADKVLRASARFSRSQHGQEVQQDVTDGIRRNISVGYWIQKMVEVEKDVYRAVRWQPMEGSVVAIPADSSVGFGRALESRQLDVTIENLTDSEQPETAMEAEPTTNVEPITAAVAAQERRMEMNHAAEIAEMANVHGFASRAAEWIKSGKTPDQVGREILDLRKAEPLAQPAAEAKPVVELNQRERKQYSVTRAIVRAAAGQLDGFELEISQEIEKKLPQGYQRNNGFFVPMSTRAGLDSINSTKGPEVVFHEPGEFIELLRNASAVVQKGARVLSGLQGPVDFPKQTGAGTASWIAENSGSDVAESNALLGTVAMSPKTLQSSTSYSRQLLAQAVIDVESLVRQDLAAIHALAWDKAALHGTGTNNQPTGIYSASGVNAVAMGGVPTFGKLVDMVTEVAKDNAIMGSLGFLSTPGMAGKMMQTLVASAAGSEMIWMGTVMDGRMIGYPALATNQVASNLGAGTNEHGIIFGNFSDLLIGQWGALELVVDPYRLKKQGMIEVTSFQMVDIVLRHVESFCKATGATLA